MEISEASFYNLANRGRAEQRDLQKQVDRLYYALVVSLRDHGASFAYIASLTGLKRDKIRAILDEAGLN